MMQIYIPHLLNATDRTRSLSFETFFDNLETLTPVRAQVSVRHGTTFLDVRGEAQTIVTLSCDRCLQQYNHRVSIQAKEIIWLEERIFDDSDMPTEYEINPEDLIESLSPQGYFEPETWIYEQICLELPQKQICDAKCQGLQVKEITVALEDIDHRWSALAALKQQLNMSDPQQN
ncbi:MAG: YceD family protein [Cyanobacteria bacterium P01_H01_bin.58]